MLSAQPLVILSRLASPNSIRAERSLLILKDLRESRLERGGCPGPTTFQSTATVSPSAPIELR
jgi:hypothetical protein